MTNSTKTLLIKAFTTINGSTSYEYIQKVFHSETEAKEYALKWQREVETTGASANYEIEKIDLTRYEKRDV